jgi:hypothetical protein
VAGVEEGVIFYDTSSTAHVSWEMRNYSDETVVYDNTPQVYRVRAGTRRVVRPEPLIVSRPEPLRADATGSAVPPERPGRFSFLREHWATALRAFAGR